MTVVLAILDGSRALMAADSGVGDGELDENSRCAEPKAWRRGAVLVGCAGSSRACNVAESARLPPFKPGADPYIFVRDELVPALDAAFRGAACAHDDFAALVAVGNALVFVDSELGVTQRALNYDAIGSGAGYALGALHATRHLRPRARAIRALAAAEQHANSVRPPWRFVHA
jgi:ATP-dependent protease HslVU (ClpYQ) peptidase subunit